jgi:hypothetical protein
MKRDWAAGDQERNYAIRHETDLGALADLFWTILGLSLLAAVLVFLAWSRSRIVSIGYESQQMHALEQGLLRSEKALALEEATLKDPARIDTAARRMGLAPVRASQLLPLPYRDFEERSAGLVSGDGGPKDGARILALARPVAAPGLETKKLAAAN